MSACIDNKKAACETYIEQTKLLVTLASAFLLAPAGLVALVRPEKPNGLNRQDIIVFIVAEALFILSVLLGYVVLGTIAGSQDEGKFDVYRKATMICSLLQLASYISGLGIFVYLIIRLAPWA